MFILIEVYFQKHFQKHYPSLLASLSSTLELVNYYLGWVVFLLLQYIMVKGMFTYLSEARRIVNQHQMDAYNSTYDFLQLQTTNQIVHFGDSKTFKGDRAVYVKDIKKVLVKSCKEQQI